MAVACLICTKDHNSYNIVRPPREGSVGLQGVAYDNEIYVYFDYLYYSDYLC